MFFVEYWFLKGEFLGKRKIFEYESCFEKHWDIFYHFWANLVQNSKLPVLVEIYYLAWLKYTKFDAEVYFLRGKFSSARQLFKLNIGTSTNSNVLNPVVMFTFSVLGRKNLFWAKLVQKSKITCFSQNFVIRKYRICWIDGNVDWKYSFWANLTQRTEIIYNGLNMVSTQIRICWIEG